jgi:dynein heavy chain
MEAVQKEYGASGDELAKIITVKNLATGGLFKWCDATLQCYDIFKDVEPKRIKAEKMKKQKEEGEAELAKTEAELATLNSQLAKLNADKKVEQDVLDDLEAKSAEMTRKLNAASQLITGLGSEQKRWGEDQKVI